jgi:hypothetical protein
MRNVWNRPAEPVQQLAQCSSSSSLTSADNDTHSTREAVRHKESMALQVSFDILKPRSAFWRWNLPYKLDVMKELWRTIPSYIKAALGVLVGSGALFFVHLAFHYFRFLVLRRSWAQHHEHGTES